MDNTKKINKVFKTILQYEDVGILLFGSRARGDFSVESDFDFALMGKDGRKLKTILITKLKESFFESTLPNKVDLVDFNNANEILKDQILKTGKKWKYLN